jgi:membrane-bound lytic murein transglycosylase D
MPSRTLLPLSLLLISACAQIPTDPTNGALQPTTTSAQQPIRQNTAQKAASAADIAVMTTAPAPAVARNATTDVPAQSAPAVASGSDSRPGRSSLPEQTQTNVAEGMPDAQVVSQKAAAALPPKNVWDRIRNGFAMTSIDNELVRDWENWYANRPDYVARMIDRSSRFLYHIVEEVEKRGMPMEVALLPMVESAYNPVAYSRSHASGIWQFIPSTGKNYGLRQNWWYDGRRDVIAATGAALDYLERLHGMFGDWNLALASYNWGEGAVGRAVERNRMRGLPGDYESLTMPAETRNYLPKLIAVKNIISNPARFGLQIADVPNEPYFETVKLKRHIDVTVAAQLAEMPLEEFKFLNPGHNKPVIRAGEGERIVLPRHKAALFMSNFESHDQPLVSWKAVRLRPGEKAEKVAASHGMTLAELKQVNGLAGQRKIMTGQPFLVPVKGGIENPQLPDMPVYAVPLPRAIQAAKHNAHSKRYVHSARGGKAVVQRGPVYKTRKQPPQLRAENGKRVKVVISKPTAKKSLGRSSPRDKIAAR